VAGGRAAKGFEDAKPREEANVRAVLVVLGVVDDDGT